MFPGSLQDNPPIPGDHLKGSSAVREEGGRRRRGWECQGSGMDRSRCGSKCQSAGTPGGHVCMYTYFSALAAESAWKRWQPSGTEHTSAQTLVSNTILHYKVPGLPGEMGDEMGWERGCTGRARNILSCQKKASAQRTTGCDQMTKEPAGRSSHWAK